MESSFLLPHESSTVVCEEFQSVESISDGSDDLGPRNRGDFSDVAETVVRFWSSRCGRSGSPERPVRGC